MPLSAFLEWHVPLESKRTRNGTKEILVCRHLDPRARDGKDDDDDDDDDDEEWQ